MPHALIIIPTHDHQDTLYASVGSVLAQTVDDWHLVIILDGAPPKAHAIAGAFAALDARISVVAQPKGPRLGEAYRDEVIRTHPAEFVFHLGDDDLWLPNHLAILSELLETADLAHSACLRIPLGFGAGLRASSTIGALTAPAVRRAIIEKRGNVVGPTQFAYRRERYLQLPEGWTTTPETWTATDIFMLSKFLAHPQLRVASVMRPTSMLVHADARSTWSPGQRAAELHALQHLTANAPAELELARSMVFERDFAGWCLSWLKPEADERLDDVLRRAGLAPIVVPSIELDALDALVPGFATVDELGYTCRSPADWLLTIAQHAELEALLAACRDEAPASSCAPP